MQFAIDENGIRTSVSNSIKGKPSEIEKMQILPVGYTKVDGVSERQSKATIGNGWTVDVITHILKGLKEA